MDPRPYHFDYRRPRPNNPTYQSNHLQDSMYQLEFNLSKSIANPEYKRFPIIQESESTILKRAHSTDLQTSKMLQKQTNNGMSSNSSFSSVQKYGGAMAGYGRNVLGANNLQRYQIFQKQAQHHDIISYSPKAIRPTLRKFPKLTLEDKLLEFGRYPKKE